MVPSSTQHSRCVKKHSISPLQNNSYEPGITSLTSGITSSRFNTGCAILMIKVDGNEVIHYAWLGRRAAKLLGT
jgi:hypothetical protein